MFNHNIQFLSSVVDRMFEYFVNNITYLNFYFITIASLYIFPIISISPEHIF